MTRVIKRKGSIKPFEADKIKGSLQRAALDAGFTLEEKQELLDEVYAKVIKELDEKVDAEGKIKSETIKVCLLAELDNCEPYIARSWRSYEEKKSR